MFDNEKKWVFITDGRGAGKPIGYVINRQLHRYQKEYYWFVSRQTGERFLTMDEYTYLSNEVDWDLIVVHVDEDLCVMPTSRFQELHKVFRTSFGNQVSVRESDLYRRPAYRQKTIFDELAPSDWGTRRDKVDLVLMDNAKPVKKGDVEVPLEWEFRGYHARHPGKLIEFISVAYFVYEMGWSEADMAELLGQIAVSNNYRNRYKRMVANVDPELAPLIRVGDFD